MTDFQEWRYENSVNRDRFGIRTQPPHEVQQIMNLALIDPFQLAQDSPESLINDLSKFSIVRRAYTPDYIDAWALTLQQDLAMPPHYGSVARAIILLPVESMARLSSGKS